MRIIALINQNSGPSYHRLVTPLMYMPGVDVYITNVLSVAEFEKGCDLFIYNRTMPTSWYTEVKKLQEVFGFRIALDIDDHWELDPHHILFKEYKDADFAALQIEHIKDADLITTTHDRLAAEIRPFNDNVHILPNAIPNKGQFDIKPIAHHLTRLFWQGSITHSEDIALLKHPVNLLSTIAKKIKMVMAGFTDGEPAWDGMASDYTANFKHQYHLLEGLHVKEYYKHYQHADICLIPLLNSPFNRHKSNLKVLEAANLGLPVICSDVHPYKDLPVVYARSGSDWVRAISKMVASKKRQRDAGQELKELCNEHYNFNKINKERKQIFEFEMSKV